MGYIEYLRKYLGHQAIMATSVTGIIWDKKLGILFEKRKDNGLWCVPGGAIEIGESLEEALEREIKEETNLSICHPILYDVRSNVHIVYPNEDEVYYTEVIYLIKEYDGDLKCDLESTELRWFSPYQLPKQIMPVQEDILKRFVENINNME